MPEFIEKDSPPRSYHHGNLRKALLDAALELLEAGERHGLSLRTVAARAGVSSGAPYRHFQDREALLAALATIGFDRLSEALTPGEAAGRPPATVVDLGSAYLAFAAANPALYRLMFTENHLAQRFDEGLANSSAVAFLLLQRAVAEESPQSSSDEARLLASTLWAGVHGIAMLNFEHLLPPGAPPEAQTTEAGTEFGRAMMRRLATRLITRSDAMKPATPSRSSNPHA